METRRRSSADSNSPEFEFWMVRNPSCPQPNLPSADELIADGVLLPLDSLHLLDRRPSGVSDPDSETNRKTHQEKYYLDDPPDPVRGIPDAVEEQGSRIVTESPAELSVSKRWTDIFKKGKKEEEKKKKKEKKRQSGAGGGGGAELNINLWPFSRSRSAGNETRPRWVSGSATRKASSAPCSRSNSASESKSRKWPSSPSRGGVHLGRSSPVWQVRRGPVKGGDAQTRIGEKSGETSRRVKGAGGGMTVNGRSKVLNLNVPMCIGYRAHLSCRSDDKRSISGGGSGGGGAVDRGCGGEGGDTNNIGSSAGLFNLRSLFTKKVY